MEKLTAIASKLTNHGRIAQSSVIQVDKIDTPLVRLRVVEAERLRLNAKFLVGVGYVKLFEVRVAVEEFLVVRDALILNPDIGVVEAIRETADVSLPVADQKIKVVRPIPSRSFWIRTGLSVKRGRGYCGEKENEEHGKE
jgi:hypothetical protein